MANLVTNIAKGRFIHYATLPAADDALIAVVLEATGLEADGTLIDHDTLADLLAGTSTEQTTMGRQTMTNVVVTVDDVGDLASFTFDAITWPAAAGNATGKLIIAYDPDTTGGTDADLIPLTVHDFTTTPDGNDVVATPDSLGVGRALGPCP